MSQLSLSDLKVGRVLSLNDQPYVITFTQHIKVARGSATVKTKLKNLVDGSTLDKSFSGSDKIEGADLAHRKSSFLYEQDGTFFFMDGENFEQYEFDAETMSDIHGYLTEGVAVDALLYNGKAVSIELPKKVELKVESAPPGIKGDSSGSVTKTIVLETGLEVRAPLFINAGDVIRINTETGEYVERAN